MIFRFKVVEIIVNIKDHGLEAIFQCEANTPKPVVEPFSSSDFYLVENSDLKKSFFEKYHSKSDVHVDTFT